MKREIRIFFTAIMFLTRIHVPKFVDHDPSYISKSRKYFPLIGWIVGTFSVFVFLVINKYFSLNLAILASMIAGILMTGAFHEDGFADCCDAFGGGWTKEKILAIMKDSRLGTYGVIGLISILAVKFLLILELPKFTPDFPGTGMNILYNYRYFIFLIIAAHSTSRLMAVYVIQTSAYVTDPANSKSSLNSSDKLSVPELLIAIFFGVAPLFFLPWKFSLILLVQLYGAYSLRQYFKKWINGYTGDCLGAVQQVTEIIFYLGATIVWQFLL
ncbi:MAG: adenosylcobinamide-GDP ribazoletransferase [Bacteroidetes bacterium]|nr:MAG: adenosylcobinamide-GDP ribazoletransferase [Bacteroidota bacterium]